ncbi:apoptosis regulator BAX-like isoform X2 [Xenia sp. Carnegie-2017]|uniref:apoptosis regulator BAX-like isoform X2 n=1 Tax=Xenia sp. Carnegie-2017 TaxID=2897299 RepID=UPI001F04D0F1|nr:apoptosis regulator BAX-like isoform X2 [Xenia sp. Carnegie-2017]
MINAKVNDEVASCLRQVGDDLERNFSLNELIGKIRVTPQTAFDTFADVAKLIFSDGVYNWGRVVTLLYFGFKLASSVASQLPLLKLVVDWVVRFVKEKLVNWIAEHGGWTAIKEYAMATVRGASNIQVAGVLCLGVSVILIAIGRSSS